MPFAPEHRQRDIEPRLGNSRVAVLDLYESVFRLKIVVYDVFGSLCTIWKFDSLLYVM